MPRAWPQGSRGRLRQAVHGRVRVRAGVEVVLVERRRERALPADSTVGRPRRRVVLLDATVLLLAVELEL
jgi:hypothetical protein